MHSHIYSICWLLLGYRTYSFNFNLLSLLCRYDRPFNLPTDLHDKIKSILREAAVNGRHSIDEKELGDIIRTLEELTDKDGGGKYTFLVKALVEYHSGDFEKDGKTLYHFASGKEARENEEDAADEAGNEFEEGEEEDDSTEDGEEDSSGQGKKHSELQLFLSVLCHLIDIASLWTTQMKPLQNPLVILIAMLDTSVRKVFHPILL